MFVTFFGIGKIKYASGTFASLITTIILFYCFHILNLSNQLIFYSWLAIFIYSFYAVSKYIKNNDDKDPNRFYYRSDHYNFAKKNIPVIFYFNGTHEDYHAPGDTPDKINYEMLAKRSQLIFHTAWELANRNDRIKIN